MRVFSWFGFAVLLTVSAAGETRNGPEINGKIMLRYHPITCIKAPCPAGTYTIEQDGKPATSVARIVVDPATPQDLQNVIDGNRLSEGVAIDGEIWIDRTASAATILPRRVLPGEWKPVSDETPPHTLTIVNQTGDVIRGIHLAPASADHWGPDRMGDNLQAGESRILTLPTTDCDYEIRIVLGDRPAEELRRQDVCTTTALTADRSGTIVQGRATP